MSPELKELLGAKDRFSEKLRKLKEVEDGMYGLLYPLITDANNFCSIEIFNYAMLKKLDETIEINKYLISTSAYTNKLKYLKILRDKIESSKDLLIFT